MTLVPSPFLTLPTGTSALSTTMVLLSASNPALGPKPASKRHFAEDHTNLATTIWTSYPVSFWT